MTTKQDGLLYYYRPIAFYGGKLWKCAGHGAEKPEHRAFYEPYFARRGDDDKTFLRGCKVMPYAGDRVEIVDGQSVEAR
jgi:hypothetical protein